MHIALIAISNIFHNAKHRLVHFETIFQIMELGTKQGNKTHLQPNKCIISSTWKKPKVVIFKVLIFKDL